jgi:hypothetical protein
VRKVSSSQVQSAIIYFSTLVSIKPEDIVDARADKSPCSNWQRLKSFTLEQAPITNAHVGARVGWDNQSAPTLFSPGMCSSWRMQGIPDATSMAMRKRTRQRTIGLVSRNVFFSQDRVDLLSAHILKTCPPTGAGTVVAQVKASTTFMMTPMSSSGLMCSPLQPGCGSHSPTLRAFIRKRAAAISGRVMRHVVFHCTEYFPRPS